MENRRNQHTEERLLAEKQRLNAKIEELQREISHLHVALRATEVEIERELG